MSSGSDPTGLIAAPPHDVPSTQTVWSDRAEVRQLLGRHLVGKGVELGPGHQPFELVFTSTQVSYVDRWHPDENRALFPELGDADFPKPDIVANLDVDRLKPLDDQSQDFVIASHLLEHLADPLGIVHEIHRVLRPGGTVLILLPDRRRTFDAGRAPTPLDHTVREFEAQVTEVDDDHILEYVTHTRELEAHRHLHGHDDQVLIEAHRRRSIHAHCWHEDEFVEVLLYGIEELDHQWDFVDGALADDQGPDGIEFGYVLRRSPLGGLTPTQRRRRFTETWGAWSRQRRQLHDLQHAIDTQTNRLQQLEAELASRRTPVTWRATVRDIAQQARTQAARRGRGR